ncbi:hypothetical protein C7974DRAFT_369744 [Boeremia exigua]|uniref:uncharacterized protein n=1 Tax=Boeremia exigua TaxID=749465 RepID=UPI001E8CB3CD|nr:uncharacterized protein C7974DRAFT_369744 [Boeremia exigua]KAH6612707.1 hypothetical protein C7974DRAFT_369744 [Boeremia exigua]
MTDHSNDTCKTGSSDTFGTGHPRDIRLQLYISVTLGVGAFLLFCFLRPRWKGLYAARKKQNNLATSLPELPDTFLGWIIPLWRITDEQVLASAGLDAYVYLAFFKMAIKFLLVTLFFALTVIKPVHDTHQEKEGKKPYLGGDGDDTNEQLEMRSATIWSTFGGHGYEYYTDYLWMYLVFVYLFTALILYLIVSETRRIIDIRQEYLGSQTTITDRTIRLSGIPLDLRSNDEIKQFIEDLGIGRVESVTLCRNWKELDDKITRRQTVLRKLEEAWTVHLGSRRVERSLETLPVIQPLPNETDSGDREDSRLLNNTGGEPHYVTPHARQRPVAKVWYGPLKLRYRTVDAIDYYEEKLRRLDDEIRDLRKKDFEPTPLAFVTMDSVASAQMAIQAVLDPSPLQLLANNSPAPSDVVWPNTYLSRSQRIFRAWTITFFIGVLSIFWTVLLVPIAGALNTCSIGEVFPGLARVLDRHELLQSLVNTQLPTLALTLLNVLVPFLYDWLANKQGMISQGDVELSVISKNFFFTFFNFFVLFTILGTASNLVDLLTRLGEKLTSATEIAFALANSLEKLLGFYTNFIMLQAFGLFPFRLLEFGALSLYPIYLIGAKTPRDYAELVQPPVFSYGFFLPQTILIFIICVVYSVMRDSWLVILTGLAYFTIGQFVHKYQLLYAMEHRQHSTGRGWTMMCDRVIMGVVLFQGTVAGQLALKKAFKRAILVAPLAICTVWFLFVYARTYRPLMKFIALRSLRDPERSDLGRDVQEEALHPEHGGRRRPAGRLTLDEARERGMKFESGLPTRTQDLQMDQTDPLLAAAMEVSEIYLSRGVAGTRSEPVLPTTNLEPLQIASFLESQNTRRPSHSASHPLCSQMPTASQCVIEPSQCIRKDLRHTDSQSTLLPTKTQDDPTTRRSEMLHHVFPRSSRPTHSSGIRTRVSKTDYYRGALLYGRQLKSKGTFHRVVNSFFGNTVGQEVKNASPRARDRSIPSSSGSRLGSSSIHGSVPSLDLISPGAFLFSGPSLQSAGSYGTLTPRHLSLTESLRDAHTARHMHSTSFSTIDTTSFGDELLEPLVCRGVVRSMSDVLLGIDTPTEELENPLIDLKATCRFWYNTISNIAPPPVRPASGKLPTEILLSIYNYLDAKSFNAARRACRSWMMASLDKSLLKTMIHRGGWHSGSERNGDSLANRCLTATSNEEWILSRYLSRQCAMAAHWTGNGVDERSAFVESSEIDFSELANGFAIQKGRTSCALIFTSSICGKYLLVAKDTLIYVYGLENGLLEPIATVVCPRRVLAMSMNTSVGRDAVAALLEGRMGMVCELRYRRPYPEPSSEDTYMGRDGNLPQMIARSSTPAGQTNEPRGRTLPGVPDSFPYVSDTSSGSFNAIELKGHNQRFDLEETDDARTHDRNLINQTWNLDLHGPLKDLGGTSRMIPSVQRTPIESSASTIYRHLCSEDDPPRNVSICPQRRCVAFGCSAGIELHWIDALTGQSLSRWFPLTSPSDHLYFLSPRPGFESAKKLRLISSAAHPGDRPAITRRLFSSANFSSFWGSFGFEARSRQFQSCDHYHAIPLSDGHHVLFIDPSTDRLTLGCDAPLGGPVRLLHKVILNPPTEHIVPRVYTAAADMSSGARVVVACGNIIMLYSIPPDVLALSRLQHVADGQDASIWPVSLSGTEIGRLTDVCELAVQTRPDLLIWAFTYTSQCKTWRLHNYVDPIARPTQYVGGSGLVHDSYSVDEPKDVVMLDTPSSSSAIDIQAEGNTCERSAAVESGMDRSTPGVWKRIPGALAVENDSWVDTIDVGGCADAWFERGGDVVTLHEE